MVRGRYGASSSLRPLRSPSGRAGSGSRCGPSSGSRRPRGSGTRQTTRRPASLARPWGSRGPSRHDTRSRARRPPTWASLDPPTRFASHRGAPARSSRCRSSRWSPASPPPPHRDPRRPCSPASGQRHSDDTHNQDLRELLHPLTVPRPLEPRAALLDDRHEESRRVKARATTRVKPLTRDRGLSFSRAPPRSVHWARLPANPRRQPPRSELPRRFGVGVSCRL